MKIRSKEQLSDSLSGQLAWRKKELADLKYLILTPSISKIRKNVLLRSAIAMIYAHWEGFIKIGGKYFFEYLSSQKYTNDKLVDNLLTISMRTTCEFDSNSNKYSNFKSIVDFFDNKLTARSHLPYKNVIETESNLSSKVLKEITWCLGIDYSPYESKEKIINARMLNKRNHIAHGELLDVDAEEVLELRDTIITLLDLYRNQIENLVVTENYLK